MKCPQCLFDNPADTLYCGKCGARLLATEEAALSPTMTLQYPAKELSRGSAMAIFELELAKSEAKRFVGKAWSTSAGLLGDDKFKLDVSFNAALK